MSIKLPFRHPVSQLTRLPIHSRSSSYSYSFTASITLHRPFRSTARTNPVRPLATATTSSPTLAPPTNRTSPPSRPPPSHLDPSARVSLVARHFSSTTSVPSTSPTMSYSKTPSPYTVRKIGQPFTLDHRVFIEKDGVPLSPFHDIPLYANEQQTVLNMVVEIPRWTNAKLEISKEELLNPIKQDIKKGKLRFVRNCFPHKGYLWNYGAFPQVKLNPTYAIIHSSMTAFLRNVDMGRPQCYSPRNKSQRRQ
jgi:inorganic pyrophosphatase